MNLTEVLSSLLPDWWLLADAVRGGGVRIGADGAAVHVVPPPERGKKQCSSFFFNQGKHHCELTFSLIEKNA